MTTKRSRAGKAKQKRKPATATAAAALPDDSELALLNPMRAGMPAIDSITEVKEVGRGKRVYRIIKTTEVDEYELPPASARKRAGKKR